MPITLDGTNGITTPTYGGADTSEYLVPVTAFKNRLINSDMRIDQRNAGASVTPNGSYTLDRWRSYNTQTSKFTVQQNAGSVTPPAGFRNYLGVTSSSAYSVTSSDYFAMIQPIEGFNFADMNWGTANAQTITISFWVRSSLTGTFGGALGNAAFDRSYPFTYTISTANTWEYKTITIAGDTSGTWVGATNGVGVYVQFGLGAGSTVSSTAGAWASGFFVSATGATSVVGTNGATFYITGVQLEVGSTATSFDYRPYGTELALCQRYFVKYGGEVSSEVVAPCGMGANSTSALFNTPLPVPMRSQPTVAYSSINFADAANPTVSVTSATLETALCSTKISTVTLGASSGITANRPYYARTANSSGFLNYSAEL